MELDERHFRYDFAKHHTSSMPMKFRPKLTPYSAALLVILLIIVIWGATHPIAIRLPQNTFQEPLNSSYNVLNVLFTALAFGGVLITLIFLRMKLRAPATRLSKDPFLRCSRFSRVRNSRAPKIPHSECSSRQSKIGTMAKCGEQAVCCESAVLPRQRRGEVSAP